MKEFFRKSAAYAGLHRCPTVFIFLASMASLVSCVTPKLFQVSLPLGGMFILFSCALWVCTLQFYEAHLWLLDED